ncbi:Very-long-chain 3-oxoacyl-CoA reductase [Colletotrichum spinosum]|uniref:Very-long-chain 3-oxoacyl-CoA reductase n=1 Tax=Colletotrichum spinosum TaxID=1347390 RepID=A0A4R8PQD7_9PEZI|nr:Very-long-chain 3-oxoacyl-CoA reductase [Colletotrichum spinosum]
MFGQVLKAIGLAWVLYACYRLYDVFALWILPSVPLKRYQKKGSYESWALVTGASAGIGLGCAQELALCGFNVVLLGHNEDELEDARSLIENECLRRHKNDIAVRILVLDAATSTPDQIEAAVNKMDDLDITVLVNNVGGPSARSPALGSLHEFTAEEVESTINLNARFMAHLTRLMVPILAKSGPSLMLNVSSTARAGIPGAAVYAGAKGFVSSFSNAIAREIKFEGKKIDVLCVVPGEVDTKSNVLGMGPDFPTGRQFAKAAVAKAGRAAQRGMLEMTPWFRHAAQLAVFDVTPEWLRGKAMVKLFKTKRETHKKTN